MAELLREAWTRDKVVDVLRSEVDAGVDLVLVSGSAMRSVQLKSSRKDSRTSRQTIGMALAQLPGACVIWIRFGGQLDLSYLFLEGSSVPWGKLAVAKNPRGDAAGVKHQRPNHRVVSKGYFRKVDDIKQLFDLLFG